MVTIDDTTFIEIVGIVLVVLGALIGYLIRTERRLTRLEVKFEFYEPFERGVETGKSGVIVALEDEREVNLIRKKREKK